MKQKNFILILSSPSGAGKTSLSKRILLEDSKFSLSISVTTRAKRPKEEDKKDYYFINKQEFEIMKNNGELLEHAQVFDNYYGSPKQPILDQINNGNDVLFDIDWQGAQSLKEKLGNLVVSIFILPPSLEELEKRLRNRGQDSDESIAKRLQHSKFEMSKYPLYDYVLVNEDFDETLEKISAIIRAERLRHMDFSGLVKDMIG